MAPKEGYHPWAFGRLSVGPAFIVWRELVKEAPDRNPVPGGNRPYLDHAGLPDPVANRASVALGGKTSRSGWLTRRSSPR